MDWETKLQALNALIQCKLIMRKPGDWYVSQGIEIKEHGGCTLVGAYGNGESPEQAVEQHWQELTEIGPQQYLVFRAYADGIVSKRLAVRWNGFMWDHVEEQKAAS